VGPVSDRTPPTPAVTAGSRIPASSQRLDLLADRLIAAQRAPGLARKNRASGVGL
jgi:hypothetical protein